MFVVVNWFQIMFLFLVRQQEICLEVYTLGCELISNYVLIFGSTTLNTFAGGGDSCELISNYVLIFGSTTLL